MVVLDRRRTVTTRKFANLAFGKWGTDSDNETFIEICSDKGNSLVELAVSKRAIETKKPSKKILTDREKRDGTALREAAVWRKRHFKPVLHLGLKDRLKFWIKEFEKCIKCYGCRDACPICYCESCLLEANRNFLESGVIPPDTLFPFTRLARVAHSCINGGQ